MVAAGRLVHQITLQAQTRALATEDEDLLLLEDDGYLLTEEQPTTRNALGEAVRGWEDLDTVWADIQPLAGRELWAAAQVQATTTHRIVIRHLSGLDPSCRVLFGSRVFGIDAIRDPGERTERLELLCTEGIADGG